MGLFLRRGVAVREANRLDSITGENHYVVWDPVNYREIFTASGYVVKSEAEMIETYGTVEDGALLIVHASAS